MLVTEKEAAELWCPLARAPGGMFAHEGGQDKRIGVTQNRGYQMGGPLSNCMCIGSRCMAWRWGEPPRSGTEFRRVYVDYEATATTQERAFTTEGKGYCGAFGKVEP